MIYYIGTGLFIVIMDEGLELIGFMLVAIYFTLLINYRLDCISDTFYFTIFQNLEITMMLYQCLCIQLYFTFYILQYKWTDWKVIIW
jgi:hypothetical protein